MPCVPNSPQRSTQNKRIQPPPRPWRRWPHAHIRNRSTNAGRIADGTGQRQMIRHTSDVPKMRAGVLRQDRASRAALGLPGGMRGPMFVAHRFLFRNMIPDPLPGRGCVSRPIDVGFGRQTQSHSLTRLFLGFRVASVERDALTPHCPNGWLAFPQCAGHDAACRHAIETSRSASHRQRFPETGSCPCLLSERIRLPLVFAFKRV